MPSAKKKRKGKAKHIDPNAWRSVFKGKTHIYICESCIRRVEITVGTLLLNGPKQPECRGCGFSMRKVK